MKLVPKMFSFPKMIKKFNFLKNRHLDCLFCIVKFWLLLSGSYMAGTAVPNPLVLATSSHDLPSLLYFLSAKLLGAVRSPLVVSIRRIACIPLNKSNIFMWLRECLEHRPSAESGDSPIW